MSAKHRAQLQKAKANFVAKLTKWIDTTSKDPSVSSMHDLVNAGLMRRILDAHVLREATTQKVDSPGYFLNRNLIGCIREHVFMRLCQIDNKETYMRILFEILWDKAVFKHVKDETKALIEQWYEFPDFRMTFPYTSLGAPEREVPRPAPREPERPKADPKPQSSRHIPDAWDDEEIHTPQTPAEQFAALAREFGVPQGARIGAAYKRLALLMHPDKHPAAESDRWTARMKGLNALRDALMAQ